MQIWAECLERYSFGRTVHLQALKNRIEQKLKTYPKTAISYAVGKISILHEFINYNCIQLSAATSE